MKTKVKNLLVALVALSLCAVQMNAQQVSSTEQKITQLREMISKYEAIKPSAETQSMHRKRIKELQIELLSALQSKRNIWKTFRREIPAEDVSQISEADNAVRETEAEILKVEQSLKDNLTAAATPTTATPTPPPPPVQPETAGTPPVKKSPQKTPKGKKTLKAGATDTTGGSAQADDNGNGEDDATQPSPVTKSAATEAANPTTMPDCRLVQAAPGSFSGYAQSFCAVVFGILDRKSGDSANQPVPAAGVELSQDEGDFLPVLFRKLAKDETEYNAIVEAEERRTDKQVGSDPKNAGTTSLAVKGGVPSAFGAAVENGAAVATTSGTTVTFRFNPVGTINALANRGFISSYREDENDAFLRFLRKTSVGVSFDASRGNEPNVFTGDRQQISAFSVRYEFLNERNPRHKKYRKDWEQFIARDGIAFQKIVDENLDALEIIGGTSARPVREFKDAALQKWLNETNQLLAAVGASPEEIQNVLAQQLDKLPVTDLSTDTVNSITRFATGLGTYLRARKEVLGKIAKGNVVTFEYTNNREVTLPDTSNFRFIAETGTKGGLDLTANASLTIFNKKPAGVNVSRVRDFQFAGQLDLPLGDATGLGQSILSFAGKYERLLDDASTMTGTVMPNTKGDIAVGQLKLTIPLRGTGMRLPISVTFANRTEFIKEKEVRANFGFTFDLDTILAKFKPF